MESWGSSSHVLLFKPSGESVGRLLLSQSPILPCGSHRFSHPSFQPPEARGFAYCSFNLLHGVDIVSSITGFHQYVIVTYNSTCQFMCSMSDKCTVVVSYCPFHGISPVFTFSIYSYSGTTVENPVDQNLHAGMASDFNTPLLGDAALGDDCDDDDYPPGGMEAPEHLETENNGTEVCIWS